MATDDSTETQQIHEAATVEYLEQAWNENREVLHHNLTRRLCSVERCLSGISTIARIMSLDERNAEESRMEETKYAGLSAQTRWGLRQALIELTTSAQSSIEQIREREWMPPTV